MGLLYGRAGRLTAQNGGFRPGQAGAFKNTSRTADCYSLARYRIARERISNRIARAKFPRSYTVGMGGGDCGSDGVVPLHAMTWAGAGGYSSWSLKYYICWRINRIELCVSPSSIVVDRHRRPSATTRRRRRRRRLWNYEMGC